MTQRNKMRDLFAHFRGDEDLTVNAYAKAEQRGEIARKSNSHNWNSVQYAKALLRDGKRRHWIT